MKASGFLRHWLKYKRSEGGSTTFTADRLFHVLSFNQYCLSIFYVPGTVLGSGDIRPLEIQASPMGDKAELGLPWEMQGAPAQCVG